MELDHEKLDVYRVALDRDAARKGKNPLVRIAAMLTRMIERGNQVREEGIGYGNGNEEDSGQQEGAGDSQ